jgi:hypothetical protein
MISARAARIDDNLGRGTDGSNPLPSSKESVANLTLESASHPLPAGLPRGAAHTDWQVIGTVDYALNSWINLRLGYRSLNFGRRYAIARRPLSRAERRRHGLRDHNPERWAA